ncbi:MAG: hypothetical protein ACOY31_11340 [Bacillota bacterium]
MNIKHSFLIICLIGLLFIFSGCGQTNSGQDTAAPDNYAAGNNPAAGAADASPQTATPPANDTTNTQTQRAVTTLTPQPAMVSAQSVELSGKTAAGNRIFIDGTEVPTDSAGGFKFPYSLKVGQNQIQVVTLGKEKELDRQTLTIERRPPPPDLYVVTPESSESETVTVSGKTDKGCVVYVNTNLARPDREGNFTSTVQLKEGVNNIKVTSTSSDGGTSVVDKKITFTPPTPRLEVIVPGDASTNQVTISGITDTNTALVLYVNDIKSSINMQNGIFSGTVTLQEGLNSITVTAINKWGKKNSVTNSIYYTKP